MSGAGADAEVYVTTGECPLCGEQVMFTPRAPYVECSGCWKHIDTKSVLKRKDVTSTNTNVTEFVQLCLLAVQKLGTKYSSKRKQTYESDIPPRKHTVLEDVALDTDAVYGNVSLSASSLSSLFGNSLRSLSLQEVKGLCGHTAKMIAPYVTTHRRDKDSGGPVRLKDPFNCGNLANRFFAIEEEFLHTPGYGEDRSGSAQYLRTVLDEIKRFNEDEDRLVPIHADGDGHCLVHALSRAIVGREFFWHALRMNMQQHMRDNRSKYEEFLKDFIEKEEWDLIIAEASPTYKPPHNEYLGLRKVHVFALSNVLRRPIILLDGLEGMSKAGDFSAVYLPLLEDPLRCRDESRGGAPFMPLVVAWSSSGYNHYVPLVPIKGKPLPRIHKDFLPGVWGGNYSDRLAEYVTFDHDGCVTIGGTKEFSDGWKDEITQTMRLAFEEEYGVTENLVHLVYTDIFKGTVLIPKDSLISKARSYAEEEKLWRCLHCRKLQLVDPPYLEKDLLPGGFMYEMMISTSNGKKPSNLTPFVFAKFPGRYFIYYSLEDRLEEASPNFLLSNLYIEDMFLPGGSVYADARAANGEAIRVPSKITESVTVSAIYDKEKDRAVIVDLNNCNDCGESIRKVDKFGMPVLKNMDETWMARSGGVGFKVNARLDDGRIVMLDNMPWIMTHKVRHAGQVYNVRIMWIEGEADASVNTNPYLVASNTIGKLFPGDFSSKSVELTLLGDILDAVKLKKEVTQLTAERLRACESEAWSSPSASLHGKSLSEPQQAGDFGANWLADNRAAQKLPASDAASLMEGIRTSPEKSHPYDSGACVPPSPMSTAVSPPHPSTSAPQLCASSDVLHATAVSNVTAASNVAPDSSEHSHARMSEGRESSQQTGNPSSHSLQLSSPYNPSPSPAPSDVCEQMTSKEPVETLQQPPTGDKAPTVSQATPAKTTLTLRVESPRGKSRLTLKAPFNVADFEQQLHDATQVPREKRQIRKGQPSGEVFEPSLEALKSLKNGDQLFVSLVEPPRVRMDFDVRDWSASAFGQPTSSFGSQRADSSFTFKAHHQPDSSQSAAMPRPKVGGGFSDARGSSNPFSQRDISKKRRKAFEVGSSDEDEPSAGGSGDILDATAKLQESISKILKLQLATKVPEVKDLRKDGWVHGLVKVLRPNVQDGEVITLDEWPGHYLRYNKSLDAFEECEPVSNQRGLGSNVAFRPTHRAFEGRGMTLGSRSNQNQNP